MISVNEFTKKNWIAVIGVFIGLLGFISSIYFYQISKKEREPYFIIKPTRIGIIDHDRLSETQLRVVRKDGSEIEGNVSVVQFYLWNAGKEPIKKSNILEPLTIALQEPNIEIIDYRILEISRKVVNPSLIRDPINSTRKLIFSFDIMEKGDGISCQIIFKGNKNAELNISGTIEGAKRINTKIPLSVKFPKIFLIILAALSYYLLVMNKKTSQIIPDKINTIKINVFKITIIIVYIGLLLLFYVWAFSLITDAFKTNIYDIIPESLSAM